MCAETLRRTGVRILPFLILIVISLQTAYSETVTYDKKLTGSSVSLKEKAEWYIDQNSSETPASIRDKDFNDSPRIDFHLNTGTLWARYSIRSMEDQYLILFSRWHKADYVRCYIEEPDGQVTTHITGNRVPFAGRTFNHRWPAFPLRLRAGETTTLYMSIQSISPICLDFSAAAPSSFFRRAHVEDSFLNFYFGFLTVIILYNFMVYVISRDRNYLLYVLYVIFMLLYQLSVEGIGDTGRFTALAWFMPRSYNVFIALVFSTGMLFARSYLDLKKNAPLLDKIGQVEQYFFLCVGILSVFSTAQWLVLLGTFCILTGVITILFSGFYILHRRYEPALFFVLAWGFLMLGTMITTMKRIHWLPYNMFTEYAIHIGNMLEVVFLALALGERVRLYQKKRLEAEEALIEANSKVMQDRMKPHFLFNSMNIIFNQLRQSPVQAQNTLQSLSDNYHFLTESDKKPLVRLEEEWRFLANYLGIMEQRWPDQTEFELNINPKLGRLPVPPIIIQPLAENAFKYGLKNASVKRLSAAADIEDGQVIIRVGNSSDANSLGSVSYDRSLGNIRSRLKRYYPDAELTLKLNNGTVTAEISFTYPGGP